MSVSVLPRESALMPQKADGLGAGALMAVLVHLLLIMALAFGVNWHASEPEGVTAELWAAVPQAAAPKAVEPPPQPVKEPPKPKPEPKVEPPPPKPVQRDADIALEKEREKQKKLKEQEEQREKAQKEKLEREKAEKLKAEKEKAEAEKRRKEDEAKQAALREKLRQEQLQRIQGALGGTGAPNATGTAARDAGPSATYAGRIKGRIKPNIVFTDEINSLPGNPVAEVELRVAPDGTIIGRRIIKSSGVSAWDDAVVRAIDRTEVLPRDVDGRVPSSMVIAFRPKD